MMTRLDTARTVNTIQTYNFEDSMQVMRDDKCLELGISSLYTFSNSRHGYTVAGDACADIMIHYDENRSDLGIELVGPHDDLDSLDLHEGCRYFGIRFLPGYSPLAVGECITDIRGSILELESGDVYDSLIEAVCGHETFETQCREVLRCMDRFQVADGEQLRNTQWELARWLLDVMISDKKKYSLAELEQASGYSSRYLNKVFRMYTGYTISKFANIMRTQRVGGYLCMCKKNGRLPDYSGIACGLDYTDQAHMIHDFEKHFGMAPMLFYKTYAVG